MRRTRNRYLSTGLSLCLLAVAPCGAGEPLTEAQLRAAIPRAIQTGRKNLLTRFEGLLKKHPADYPMGRLAFPLAALLKAGLSSHEPRVQAALTKLEAMDIRKTYGVACYLLALDALCQRRYEEAFESIGESGSARCPTRRGEGKIRSSMEELTRWLVSAQLRSHGSWTYSLPRSGSRHDFSNTQFAVLGLEIAMQHGIEVPTETLLQVARCFTRAVVREKGVFPVRLRRELPLAERVRSSRTAAVSGYRIAPGGWPYTDPTRSRTAPREPTPSMTAAGASSLAIVLEGLRARGMKAPAEAEGALLASQAWIARHFDEYLLDGKNLHYTLYSLEKVGDVTALEEFNGRAWYLEGARKLLDAQDAKGSWGSYVNTSLALLFLTRATRCSLSASPVLLTGGKETPPGSRDLVYVDSLGGFLSARGLLRHLGETRSATLVPLCEEAVRNYTPDRVEELLPSLLLLWSKPDRVTKFARSALTTITGVTSRKPEEYVAWYRKLESIRDLEALPEPSADQVAMLLRSTRNLRLKGRLVTLAGRKGLRSLAEFLIRELEEPSVQYRQRLHGALSLFWVEPPAPAPAGNDPREWEKVAEAWKEWWAKRGRSW